MRLYLAGNMMTWPLEELAFQTGCRNRLLTFAEVATFAREAFKYWIELRPFQRERERVAPGGSFDDAQEEAFRRDWLSATPTERDEFVKLYVAGNGKSDGSPARDHATGTRNRLLSYAFVDDWAREEFQFWLGAAPRPVSVFLDSGAFSAFTLGRTIDLGEYCAYVEAHRDALAAYAALDVIGDEAGTARNLSAMRARGLDPVAIFHVGFAPPQVLEGLLADMGPSRYVALGGMASERIRREELQAKLDACWRRIEHRWPVRVHGLGVMAQWALERYPWYSVDSSSAIMGAGMGRVQRWERGELAADGWRDDLRRRYDGAVADNVDRVRNPDYGVRSGSAHEGRRRRNIEAQLALERYVTDLWRLRGVEWPE